MSAPVCVSCRESLSCGDSPLSITGNIIGILTFIGALAIGIQVYFNSMKNAERNMFEMADTLQMRYEKVKRLKNKLGNQSKNIDADLKARLHHAMDRVQNPLEQTGKLLDRQYNSWRSEKSQFWIRAKFVMRENLIKEGLEKMERAMQTLDEAANDVFSDVEEMPAEHELEFRRQILQQQVNMKNEIESFMATNSQLLNEVRTLLEKATRQP